MSRDNLLAPRNHISTVYDKLYYVNQVKTNPFLKRVGLNKILEILNKRSPYDYIKIVALERWYTALLEEIELFNKLTKCQETDTTELEDISHNVFSWSYDDFIKRRKLDNSAYIGIMLRESSGKCLEQMKLKTDFKELKKYIDTLFQLMMDSMLHGKRPDMEVTIFRPLREAEYFAEKMDEIDTGGVKMMSYSDEIRRRTIQENVIGRLKHQNKQLRQLENLIERNSVWVPIEMRYQTKWFHTEANQKIYQSDITLHNLEREILDLKKKTNAEKYCSSSVCNAYYADAEKLKRSIREWQHRYDTSLDGIENDIMYTKSQMERYRNHKKFNIEEIERFHYEIEQRLQKEERLRKRAEEDKLAQEAAGLAKYREERRDRLIAALKKLKSNKDPKGKFAREKAIAQMERRLQSVSNYL